MATTTEEADFQDPQFFISQSEKLSALLDIVVYESKSATNPDALVDYLELTYILTDLLDEARFYSVLTADEILRREQDVQSYVSKVRTVQEAVGDWDARTQMAVPVSRKRGRAPDLAEETMGALKRQRGGEMEPDIASASLSSPVLNVLPSIEQSPTPWWTEPFYD